MMQYIEWVIIFSIGYIMGLLTFIVSEVYAKWVYELNYKGGNKNVKKRIRML